MRQVVRRLEELRSFGDELAALVEQSAELSKPEAEAQCLLGCGGRTSLLRHSCILLGFPDEDNLLDGRS